MKYKEKDHIIGKMEDFMLETGLIIR